MVTRHSNAPAMAWLLALGFSMAFGHKAEAAEKGPAYVETSSGPIQGTLAATTISYLGIPYAQQPVGKLRWQPPQAARPWKGVLNATKFGKHCLQAAFFPNDSAAGEDCLFLNGFVPRSASPAQSSAKGLKPVMVWIHGGGNEVGKSDGTDPTSLLEIGDVVVVTLNYRLGPFGFLAHPALDAEGHPSVNYGILDQQLALKWVRANIASFGGDPRNVTIFGESAGGLNTLTHLLSPLSAGLFDRAIVQSGAYQLDTPSLATSQAAGVAFAARAGCPDQTAACLRSLSAEKILANVGAFSKSNAAHQQSTVDGKILVETQRSALKAGRINRVPVMQGSTRDEGPVFNCGAQAANELLSKWMPVYAYEFGDRAASSLGAAHATELKYLFDMEKDKSEPAFRKDADPEIQRGIDDAKRIVEAITQPLSEASRPLAKAMRVAWTNFARSGNPQSDLIPNWPLATKGIQLLEPALGSISPADFAARHQCASYNASSAGG